MKIGETTKLKSRIKDPEKLDRFRLLNSYMAHLNDVRCSVLYTPHMVHTRKGVFYESELNFLEMKRKYDKKYNPTFLQKNFPAIEEGIYNLKKFFS